MTNAFPALGRQAATRQTYERTGARLAKRLSDATGTVDPAVLVAEFLTSARKFSQNTFRLYKAALLQHLTEKGVAPSVLHLLTNASSKDCVKSSERTSGHSEPPSACGPHEVQPVGRIALSVQLAVGNGGYMLALSLRP